MNIERYDELIKMSHEAYISALEKCGDVDEISLLFDSHEDFQEFVREAKKQETWFAQSKEEQILQQGTEEPITYPPSRRYRTTYEFIWPSPFDGYRIEAMYVHGLSRIHEALFEWRGSSVVVAHASFKCKDLSDYNDALMTMRHSNIREFVAEYENGYGRFSYFTAPGLGFYIKPRVNLREG